MIHVKDREKIGQIVLVPLLELNYSINFIFLTNQLELKVINTIFMKFIDV